MGLDGDAVATEPVEGVAHLAQRPLDVGQRQGREVPESVGVGVTDRGSVVVHPPGETAGGGVVAEVHAGGGDREHRGGDVVVVHEHQVVLDAPARPARHPVGVAVSGGDGGVHVLAGQEVGVDVDQR